MGASKCRGVVRLDSLRDFGGLRNHPSFENATDPAARDILQSPVAYSCCVPTLVEGQVGRFAGGRHHLGVLVGDITHHRCTVGVCVCELHLQTKEVAGPASRHPGKWSLRPTLAEEISENPCCSGNREGLGVFAPIRMIVEIRKNQRYPHE